MMSRGSILFRLSAEAVIAAFTASAAAYLFYVMLGHFAGMAIFELAGVNAWGFLAAVFAVSFPAFLGIFAVLDDKMCRHRR